ncbi:BRE1 [Hepatospora eriocheir]|uniref:E3 ubiquitin protein ligase n=1 Tax=Hepatospora eriocheir TaxID=1081669 RepID=A0A1X0QBM4_9MICR|nr:BRE1 [Hepatospora eriocheir]
MVKMKGIKDKIGKKRFDEIQMTLKKMVEKHNISNIKDNLSKSTDLTTSTNIQDEQNTQLANDSTVNKDLSVNKQSLIGKTDLQEDLEDDNSWNVKKIKFTLKEKNDRIRELEQKLLKQTNENKKLVEAENKVVFSKVEVEFNRETDILISKYTKLIEENDSLRKELNNLDKRYFEEMRMYKSDLEKVKYELKLVNEPKEKKFDIQEYFVRFDESQNEIAKLNEKLLEKDRMLQMAKKDNNILENSSINLSRQLEIAHKRLERSLNIKGVSANQILEDEVASMTVAIKELSLENKKMQSTIENIEMKSKTTESELIRVRGQLKTNIKLEERLENNKKRLENVKKDIINQIEKYENKYSNFERIEANLNEKIIENKKNVNSYKSDMMYCEKKISDLIEERKKYENDLYDVKVRNLEIEKENKVLKSKVYAYESVIENGTKTTELFNQIDILRQYVICPLCKTNFKSHIIDKCMHCFCKDCLLDRLKVRVRNCPKCNVGYSEEDIKKIYL